MSLMRIASLHYLVPKDWDGVIELLVISDDEVVLIVEETSFCDVATEVVSVMV